jgi:hypothetical protein
MVGNPDAIGPSVIQHRGQLLDIVAHEYAVDICAQRIG